MILRCTNKKDISRIINHPKIYKLISDDLSPKTYIPIINESVLWVINEEKTGVIKVEVVNGITCQVHITVLPELWGKAKDFIIEATRWFFDNTKYLKIITLIPTYNRLAIRLAEKCGMKKEGCIKKSFLKNWKIYDQLVYGFTKIEFKEALCQQ